MEDKKTLFQKFTDKRLIEVVKNARQFGYDDSIRNTALEVLKERGISEIDLELTGNLTNQRFDQAQALFNSNNTTSKLAFFLYFAAISMEAIDNFNLFGMGEPGGLYHIVYWTVVIGFLAALIKSFFDHLNFYKSIGKELATGDQIIFFILGMPFYIIMYFVYKSRMKEEMLMIK